MSNTNCHTVLSRNNDIDPLRASVQPFFLHQQYGFVAEGNEYWIAAGKNYP